MAFIIREDGLFFKQSPRLSSTGDYIVDNGRGHNII